MIGELLPAEHECPVTDREARTRAQGLDALAVLSGRAARVHPARTVHREDVLVAVVVRDRGVQSRGARQRQRAVVTRADGHDIRREVVHEAIRVVAGDQQTRVSRSPLGVRGRGRVPAPVLCAVLLGHVLPPLLPTILTGTLRR
ncbi:hypothetical protein GCM10025863_31330 [Microbacterium suwonense]|uniref:Uncharacterized protein n=1 Tax=Microbacterium suwonense TaxID=683047 RepID=A0ABN6X748_9MICO|nr:hypothetical protein GCM10025863_31330 [Microbacterium suwonense]